MGELGVVIVIGGYMASRDYDWQYKKKWKYKGGNDPTVDPKYRRDRSKFFGENGNGWWWIDPRVPNRSSNAG